MGALNKKIALFALAGLSLFPSCRKDLVEPEEEEQPPVEQPVVEEPVEPPPAPGTPIELHQGHNVVFTMNGNSSLRALSFPNNVVREENAVSYSEGLGDTYQVAPFGHTGPYSRVTAFKSTSAIVTSANDFIYEVSHGNAYKNSASSYPDTIVITDFDSTGAAYNIHKYVLTMMVNGQDPLLTDEGIVHKRWHNINDTANYTAASVADDVYFIRDLMSTLQGTNVIAGTKLLPITTQTTPTSDNCPGLTAPPPPPEETIDTLATINGGNIFIDASGNEMIVTFNQAVGWILNDTVPNLIEDFTPYTTIAQFAKIPAPSDGNGWKLFYDAACPNINAPQYFPSPSPAYTLAYNGGHVFLSDNTYQPGEDDVIYAAHLENFEIVEVQPIKVPADANDILGSQSTMTFTGDLTGFFGERSMSDSLNLGTATTDIVSANKFRNCVTGSMQGNAWFLRVD